MVSNISLSLMTSNSTLVPVSQLPHLHLSPHLPPTDSFDTSSLREQFILNSYSIRDSAAVNHCKSSNSATTCLPQSNKSLYSAALPEYPNLCRFEPANVSHSHADLENSTPFSEHLKRLQESFQSRPVECQARAIPDLGYMSPSSNQCNYRLHLTFNGRSTESAVDTSLNHLSDSSYNATKINSLSSSIANKSTFSTSLSTVVIDSRITSLSGSPVENGSNTSCQKLNANANANVNENCQSTKVEIVADSKSQCRLLTSVSSAAATNEKGDNAVDTNANGIDCQPKKLQKSVRKTGGNVRRRRLKSGLDMIRSTRKRTPIKQNKCKTKKTTETTTKELRFDVKRFIVNKSLGETMLHRSARNNRLDIVKLCLESGFCDVDVRDNAGYTALHECSSRGNLEVARLLLEHSADANASAIGGIRPLHDAIENDHIEMTRLLLSYGADPGLLTYSGSSLLQLSCSNAMSTFLNGFYQDISTERPAKQETNILPWKFVNNRLPETGFDIFDGVPSDQEEEDDDANCIEEMLFEHSDKPFPPLYSLLNRPDRPFYLLSDVLQFSRLNQEQFTRKHTNIAISKLNRQDVAQSWRSRELQQRMVKLSDLDQSSISVIFQDDKIKHILSIDTTVISPDTLILLDT